MVIASIAASAAVNIIFLILSSVGVVWVELVALSGDSRWCCPAVARAPFLGVSVRRRSFS